MKAIRIHQHGGTDVLQIDNLEEPVPGPHEVLVKIKTGALNHLDIFVRKGIPGIRLPLIMGSDGAGIIEECGGAVHNFKAGDKIINMPFRISADDPAFIENRENLSPNYQITGEHCDGLQAEYVAIPEIFVFKKPEHISWEAAAAFPLVSLTAYHMLVQKVNLQPGQWLLVHGASSGVGSAAIQIAKILGARIIASTSSSEKCEMAKKLGADFVINYTREPIGKTAKEISDGGVNVVFDHTGEKTWKESLRALKTGGKLVTCGATSGPLVQIDLRALFIKQQQLIGSTMGTRQDMLAVAKMVESGKLKPVISRVFDFSEVREAHHFLEDGKQFGKVILKF